jgi:hypothetical protein
VQRLSREYNKRNRILLETSGFQEIAHILQALIDSKLLYSAKLVLYFGISGLVLPKRWCNRPLQQRGEGKAADCYALKVGIS